MGKNNNQNQKKNINKYKPQHNSISHCGKSYPKGTGDQKQEPINGMKNYSFPITNENNCGNPILGAYANIAQYNFDKTLQYIYGKIGLKVSGTKNYFKLEKILELYENDKNLKEDNLGVNNTGKKTESLLSTEQYEKLRTLLFHHFSVLAPILGNQNNMEIVSNYKKEEKDNDIVKKVKTVVKSAHIYDCLKVLITLSKALNYTRNLHSHYRAYNKEQSQQEMFKVFHETSTLLTNALRASAIICQSNAGCNTGQYDFITGDYHYKEKKGCKEEYDNYFYRIYGQRSIVKANGKIESNIKYNAISDFGMVYLVSLFLSKSDTELMLDQLEIFKNSPFRYRFPFEKTVLTNCMVVYRIKIPKGKRLKMEDDDVQFCMDMLNELQKCPKELYEVFTQEGKDYFKREQTAPLIDPKTGEYVREKFVKSENGQEGQQKVRSDDGTGNIVYERNGMYSLLVRKEDRFPYFALRYIDNRNLLPTIRFQIDLGYYRFAFYPKTRIDNSEYTRILQKRINGFGKLNEIEEERLKKWAPLFQDSEMKEPNDTEHSEIASDEDGNVIKIEQLIKADTETKPFVTNKRASYNIHNNRIGLFWNQSTPSEESTDLYVPDLKIKQNNDNKVRSDVNIITPQAFLSVHDLPALIFYEYLRGKDNNNLDSAEEIIKDKYEKYVAFFEGIYNKKINSWEDVEGLRLKKRDIPKKFWPFLNRESAGDQTMRIINNYMGRNFKGHIQERIDGLEKEIKKFNDICIKMVTTDNEYGTDGYKTFRPALLARKMARSIMEWLPVNSPAKKIMTGANYSVMTSVLSQFGGYSKDIESIKNMFENGGIIINEKENNKDSTDKNFHPFLNSVLLKDSIHNMENLYIEYITKELEYIKKLQNELIEAKNKRDFINTNLPFAKLKRKRFGNRNEKDYYVNLAKRYLNIDNSKNGGLEKPAIILLPDGLFTEDICTLLKDKYPQEFTGDIDNGVYNNTSYLISTYFNKIIVDESQPFYQCFDWKKEKKSDSKFNRHYKFFDYYDNGEHGTENNPENFEDRKNNFSVSVKSFSPKEINGKLKIVKRNSIKEKVEEYVQSENAKIEFYKIEQKKNKLKLDETIKRHENEWYVDSKKKNKNFKINKKEEIERLIKKVDSISEMITNSNQKIDRIQKTYFEKFVALKNECQRTEKAIRRYRIEDIITFFMISTYFKDLFKDIPENAKFRLQDIGSSTEREEAFLDQKVRFSRTIPVTFAVNEEDMFKKNWKKDISIHKNTIYCEISLNEIAIRNYNLALADLNDERLISFLTHFACIHYNKNKDKALKINYNRLSLEFKMYNQLRSEIFKEVHAIEKIIVDNHEEFLNDDNNSQFFIDGNVTRKDEDAKRNSFVNLLALIFNEKNKKSVSANHIRKSAAHNYYGMLFNKLAEEGLLYKIIKAYQISDTQSDELTKLDFKEEDPRSFAALILNKIIEIREYVEKRPKKIIRTDTKS